MKVKCVLAVFLPAAMVFLGCTATRRPDAQREQPAAIPAAIPAIAATPVAVADDAAAPTPIQGGPPTVTLRGLEAWEAGYGWEFVMRHEKRDPAQATSSTLCVAMLRGGEIVQYPDPVTSGTLPERKFLVQTKAGLRLETVELAEMAGAKFHLNRWQSIGPATLYIELVPRTAAGDADWSKRKRHVVSNDVSDDTDVTSDSFLRVWFVVPDTYKPRQFEIPPLVYVGGGQ